VSAYLSQFAAALAPITLQIDLATAAIALIALVFSIWSFRNQRRLSIETLRVQRDNDIIGWSNKAIATLVNIEFLLRDWNRQPPAQPFASRRDAFLAELSTLIDQGRLYFAKFDSDVIAPGSAPALADEPFYILDRLVLIYDLIKDLDTRNPVEIDKAKTVLLLRKRAFIAHAQREVDPNRRQQFLQG
jgi:hypothetical protein